uniref:Uncharacterized protein n=1 Tax=Avena sativa TaxID=4498 RepID=A0ACD5X092_AVESA
MSTSDLLSALRAGGRKLLSASTVAPKEEIGSHVFKIEEYRHVKGTMAHREHMESSTFTVGGHDWRIDCYPNGCSWRPSGCVALFLRRTSSSAKGGGVAIASVRFSVLDQYGNPWRTKTWPRRPFSIGDDWGWPDFISHEDLDLEKEKLLTDNCLMVLCDVTVDLGMCTEACLYTPVVVPEPAAAVEAPAPPFEIDDELTKLIWEKERANVEIKVGGETLAAHRWMLGPRSPVFQADLSLAFGTGGKKTAVLQIEDMDAEVVRTLLEFIYKNMLPEKKRLVLETAAMAERLLVAADRYELQKLKRICEEALCKHIGMTSVADTLALAERHGCPVLKEACMQFISSPGNLGAVVATDGFEQLKTGCPPALVDLMAKQIALVHLGGTI